MASPILALLYYVGWAIVLVSLIATVRTVKVLRGEAPANGFASGTKHGGDRYWRLNRAHVNTVENLPIFAAVVLAGVWVGVVSPIFNTLAWLALFARIAQSLVHIASGTSYAVSVRFTFFAAQLTCFGIMALMAGTLA